MLLTFDVGLVGITLFMAEADIIWVAVLMNRVVTGHPSSIMEKLGGGIHGALSPPHGPHHHTVVSHMPP
jgi:hypothetical protein